MKSVLFVCAGNTCRSPMAEALLRRRLEQAGVAEVRVASAGLGTWNGQAATEEAVAVLLEKGLDLRSHRSQPVTPQLVAGSDLILTMEPGQADTLRCAYPEAQERVFGLQGFAGREGKVADPYAHLGTAEVLDVYRATRDELSEAIEAAWPRLCEFLNLKKGEGQL